MSNSDIILRPRQEQAAQAAPVEAVQKQPGGDEWLCAACHQMVARERDRTHWQGASEHSFVNPAGIRFHILLFEQVQGCLDVGTPTLEHTWFPGCAWSYCLCGRCRAHLGWFYMGFAHFVALIRDRVVRASLVKN